MKKFINGGVIYSTMAADFFTYNDDRPFLESILSDIEPDKKFSLAVKIEGGYGHSSGQYFECTTTTTYLSPSLEIFCIKEKISFDDTAEKNAYPAVRVDEIVSYLAEKYLAKNISSRLGKDKAGKFYFTTIQNNISQKEDFKDNAIFPASYSKQRSTSSEIKKRTKPQQLQFKLA